MKRIWMWIIALCVCLCLVPVTAQAAEVVASGYAGWGDNIPWTLDDDGVLTISGEGKMSDDWSMSHGHYYAPWYNYADQIQTVIIEPGVTNVGYMAFYGCSSLTSVQLPDGLTVISSEAFMSCYQLDSIVIPDSVTQIGNSAFYGCSLKEIHLPKSLQTIGNNAFKGNYVEQVLLTIPRSVTSVGDNAFYNCYGVDNIRFEGDACTIGSDTFYNIYATAFYPAGNATWDSDYMQDYGGDLTWVEYTHNFLIQPEDIHALAGQSIELCAQTNSDDATYQWYYSDNGSSWTELEGATDSVLALTVTEAELGCQYRCEATDEEGTKITSESAMIMEYPEISLGTLEQDMVVEETVFYQFTPEETALYRFDASPSAINYGNGFFPQIRVAILMEDEEYWYYEAAYQRQLEAGKTYILSVQNSSYYMENIDGYYTEVPCVAKAIVNFKKVDYPELELGVRTTAVISENSSESFDYFEQIQQTNFLFKPEKTDTYTFRSFSDVKTVGEINDSYHYTEGGYGYFNGERNLGFVAERTLEAGKIYVLSTWIFDLYEEQTGSYDVIIEVSHDYEEEVISEASCTTEGTSRFTCSHCGDTYIANTPIKHSYANNYCASCGIKEVYSGFCGDNLTWEVDCTTGVLSISGSGGMYDYWGPGYGNSPGWYVACSNQYDDFRWNAIEIEEGVTYIGMDSFNSLHAGDVSEIELPDSVTEIGYSAFTWNSSLSNIKLSENLEIIGNNAFENCDALTSITIPDKVTTIGDWAFAGCYTLNEINLGKKVTSIGGFAFGNAINVTSIVIPESVTYIGGSAFSYSGLTEIRFEGDAPTFGSFDMAGDGSEYFGHFDGLTATAYYPANNPTWTDAVMQNYCGTITWMPYNVYDVLEDSDTSAVVGKNETITIHTNGELSDFVAVYVDGEMVEAANYTLTEGSTIVTFSVEYVNALSIGEHRVTVEFTDGFAYGDIIISDVPVHSYEAVVTTPSCTERGYTTYTCSRCGDSYKADYVDALGHDMGVWETTVEATCTENGQQRRACSRCDYSETEMLPKLGHDYKAVVTEPTCTEGGYTTHTCTRCNDTYTDTPVDALGHDWDEGKVTVEPTEDSAGEMLYTCIRCGETKTEVIPELDHEHSYEAIVTAPTCTERGYTTYTCRCGDSYVSDYVDALGHEMGEWEITAQATCTEEGEQRRDCSRCDHYETQVVDALGHDYVDGVCSRCGAKDPNYEEPVPGTANVIRLSGANRYNTAFAVANQLKKNLGVSRFGAVVVAYGQNFPDALTGSYLAAVKNAPILLTEPSADASVLEYIEANLIPGGKVYILGGTAAVSENFENIAKVMGFDVERLKGKNRYITNLEILKEAGVNPNHEVLIATGTNYADSLSASATGLPMLLVDKTLTEDQKAFLEGTSKRFVIIGGTGAVSEGVEAELAAIGTVVRVKGANRYGTSVAIAERYFANPKAAVLAYAQGFPDGLCGGPLAVSMGAPLILTSNESPANADAYVEDILIGAVTGGTGRISDDTVREIFDLAADTEIPKP